MMVALFSGDLVSYIKTLFTHKFFFKVLKIKLNFEKN